MTLRRVIGTLLTSAALCGTAYAGCELRDPPTVPDGATATTDQMTAAAKDIKGYVAETQEFQACLQNEGKGKVSGADADRYNKASERMERLAAEYNKQVKAFKAKGN